MGDGIIIIGSESTDNSLLQRQKNTHHLFQKCLWTCSFRDQADLMAEIM